MRRVLSYLRERREAAFAIPDGWETAEGAAAFRDLTGELPAVGRAYAPRHAMPGEGTSLHYVPRRDGTQIPVAAGWMTKGGV